jgi:ferredoxin-NADP reductase/nitrite reductase/ring-hydroxylating ferredoxin subunit
MPEPDHAIWHPVAASSDLVPRHVFHGQLQGREFAIWRADDGHVNIWENRCLHRGVRLSIGINDGRELKCQYHGWRYSNRTAGCTYIPAHPADAPARTITNRTFPMVERHGLVWSTLDEDAEPSDVTGLDGLVLRPIPVNAPADLVLRHLAAHRFRPSRSAGDVEPATRVLDSGDFSIAVKSSAGGVEETAVFHIQPVDAARSIIRGVLGADVEAAERIKILRHHNDRLNVLRRLIEDEAARLPQPVPTNAEFAPLAPELAELPEPTAIGRRAAMRVAVARKWQTAQDVVAFELRPLTGELATFQPGAHIDVHLPNGDIRQYSITNGPGEADRYVIAVKREAVSRGGSIALHNVVREGDVLAISEPRNNFPLRRDATRTLLVAGGIGITPLISMAKALAHQKLAYELHCFAQSPQHLALGDDIAALGSAAKPRYGLDPQATKSALRDLLSSYDSGMQLYICGPGPMLDAARAIAAECGWPESAVHQEYFKNTRPINDSSSFEVSLARSCVTFTVPSGKTILDVMRENGMDMPSSCEQGACGTCLATVIEGEPDHQDVYLSEAERRSGTKIMTCVSRAKSPRIVLDV